MEIYSENSSSVMGDLRVSEPIHDNIAGYSNSTKPCQC
jgi:hypothetical protein